MGGAPEQNVLTITGSSAIDPGILPTAPLSCAVATRCDVNEWLIAYRLLSHAVLLFALLWLMARHLQ